MSDDRPPEDDDIVGRVVEKAAEKAASVAASSPKLQPSGMAQWEARIAVLILIILNLAGAFLALQNRNEGRRRDSDLGIICQLLVKLPDVDLTKVASCIN